MFNLGIFESAHPDPAVAGQAVSLAEFVAAGYETHLGSVVMLKSIDSVQPMAEEYLMVYIP